MSVNSISNSINSNTNGIKIWNAWNTNTNGDVDMFFLQPVATNNLENNHQQQVDVISTDMKSLGLGKEVEAQRDDSASTTDSQPAKFDNMMVVDTNQNQQQPQ